MLLSLEKGLVTNKAQILAKAKSLHIEVVVCGCVHAPHLYGSVVLLLLLLLEAASSS
jgi:hypothetical protein